MNAGRSCGDINENVFTIDVDVSTVTSQSDEITLLTVLLDNYRIIIPRVTEDIKKISFPLHISLDHITDFPIGPKDRFLSRPFFLTLAIYCRGDVKDDSVT